MRKIYISLAAGVALSALSPAMAQDAAPPPEATAPAPDAVPADAVPAAEAPAPSAGPAHVLLSGAEVRMTTRSELSSRTSQVGDRFELEVTGDVTHNGTIVIPAGSIATGEVTRVRKKGMWGRSGILETRLVSVRAGDRQIRLSGAAGDRGRSGTAATVGAVLLSPLIVAPFVGFFITGTSAVIPVNTATVAYTDEDVPLLFAEAAPAAAASAEPVAPAPAGEAVPAPAEGTLADAATPQG